MEGTFVLMVLLAWSCHVGISSGSSSELKNFEMVEENKMANFEWANNQRTMVPLQQEDEECIYRGSFKEDPGSSVLVTGCAEENRSLQMQSLLYGDTLATIVNGSVELLRGIGHLLMNDTVENNKFIQHFKQEQGATRLKREYVENSNFLKQFPTNFNVNRNIKNIIFPKMLTLPIHIYLAPSWRSKFGGFSGGKSKAKQILSQVKLWFLHRSLDTKFNIGYQDSNIVSTSVDLNPTEANIGSLRHFLSVPSSGYAAHVYLTATTGGSLGIALSISICDIDRKSPRSMSRWFVSDIYTAQTVAHEIGHNLGFYHDFETSTPTGRTRACGPGQWNNGPNNDLMNYAPNYELTQYKWSDCTNEDFRNYFAIVKSSPGSTFCLHEDSNCEDSWVYCKMYTRYCRRFTFMQNNCKKACNLC